MHLIRVSSDGHELICEGLFSHPNEIWDLASCPFDQRIFSTVFSSGNTTFFGFGFFFFSSADNWKELGNELSYFLFMKVNHLGQQFGKFLSYMVNWIPLNWSELLLLMDMIPRLNGYSLIHVKFFSFFFFFLFLKYLLYISLEMLKQPYRLDFSP